MFSPHWGSTDSNLMAYCLLSFSSFHGALMVTLQVDVTERQARKHGGKQDQHKRRLSTFSWGNFLCRADRSCISQRLTEHKYSLPVEHRLKVWFCSDTRPKYTLQLRHGISLSQPSIRRVYEASHIIKSALNCLAQRGIVMPKHLSYVNARMCL